MPTPHGGKQRDSKRVYNRSYICGKTGVRKWKGVNKYGLEVQPYNGSKLDMPKIEQEPHVAIKEPGVLGPAIRLDEVGRKYGLPMRVRCPSGSGLTVLRPEGDGMMVDVERRHGFRVGAAGIKVWCGAILVHPIDRNWRPRKSGGADRVMNALTTGRRVRHLARHHKYARD